METSLNLHTVPLSTLTYEARELLSCLLNTPKLLLSDGPDKLPRDWRGLASLVNISAEIANSYESGDKAAKVLAYWMHKKDEGIASIGQLLEYMQRIDRYDVIDDFMDLMSKGNLVLNRSTRPPPRPQRQDVALAGGMEVALVEDPEQELITFDDKIHGYPQFYNAFVLFAQEDRSFVDLMLVTMRDRGFKLCTEEDLLPDHATTYAPVARLISSERCNRIILVYSPAFLDSPANNFYMDYAQAVGIEMKRPKIIPCMYKMCQLPAQVAFYCKLYYQQQGNKLSYDFWDRLSCSLQINTSPQRSNGTSSSSFSAINITEMSGSQTMVNGFPRNMLPLPPPPSKSASMDAIDAMRSPRDDSQSSSISGGSQHSTEGKVRSSWLEKTLSKLKPKKKKMAPRP